MAVTQEDIIRLATAVDHARTQVFHAKIKLRDRKDYAKKLEDKLEDAIAAFRAQAYAK